MTFVTCLDDINLVGHEAADRVSSQRLSIGWQRKSFKYRTYPKPVIRSSRLALPSAGHPFLSCWSSTSVLG